MDPVFILIFSQIAIINNCQSVTEFADQMKVRKFSSRVITLFTALQVSAVSKIADQSLGHYL